jgi:hypothetical protein
MFEMSVMRSIPCHSGQCTAAVTVTATVERARPARKHTLSIAAGNHPREAGVHDAATTLEGTPIMTSPSHMRRTALALALLSTTSLLAACGGEPDPVTTTTERTTTTTTAVPNPDAPPVQQTTTTTTHTTVPPQ